MRLLVIGLVAVLVPSVVLAQDPFSILSSETLGNTVTYRKGKTTDTITLEKTGDFPDGIDLFQQQVLGASTSGGDTNGNVTVNIIQYRLTVYTRGTASGDTTRYYLPLILLTKLQTNYNSNFAAADDATGYDGGLFTARLMPSRSWQVGAENRLMMGIVTDFRAIAYKDTADTEDTDTKFGWSFYTSAGVTYSGVGDVRVESKQHRKGKWSASFLAYFSAASKSVLESAFDGTQAIFGAEFMFRFNVNDDTYSKFNLFASAKWMSKNIINTSDNFIFKFAVGN